MLIGAHVAARGGIHTAVDNAQLMAVWKATHPRAG